MGSLRAFPSPIMMPWTLRTGQEGVRLIHSLTAQFRCSFCSSTCGIQRNQYSCEWLDVRPDVDENVSTKQRSQIDSEDHVCSYRLNAVEGRQYTIPCIDCPKYRWNDLAHSSICHSLLPRRYALFHPGLKFHSKFAASSLAHPKQKLSLP